VVAHHYHHGVIPLRPESVEQIAEVAIGKSQSFQSLGRVGAVDVTRRIGVVEMDDGQIRGVGPDKMRVVCVKHRLVDRVVEFIELHIRSDTIGRPVDVGIARPHHSDKLVITQKSSRGNSGTPSCLEDRLTHWTDGFGPHELGTVPHSIDHHPMVDGLQTGDE